MTMVVRRAAARSSYRALRRCVVCFATVCVLPVLLVFVVTTEQYMRPMNQRRISNTIDEYDTYTGGNLVNRSMIIGGSGTLNAAAPSFGEMTARMAKRRAHLTSACRRHGLDVPGNDSLHRPNPWEFLVNRHHHLVWCNVFKAASTSWMYNFNILAGYNPAFLKKTKVVPLHLARKKYSRPSLDELKSALNDSVSFLIVRHPLERLLSAYRDKLQFSLPHTLHQKLGNQIISKYRIGGSKGKGNNPRWPTFEEFVRYLLDVYKNGREMDMHWTPITNFCTPCMIHFDVIAKFETLRDDQTYLIHEAGLRNIIKPQWKNSGRGRTTTSQLIGNYFSQLTKNQIKQLYHIYRYDFDLFNYTLKSYIEVGRDDPEILPSTSIPRAHAT